MLEIRGFTDSALAGVESELDCLEYEDIIYIKREMCLGLDIVIHTDAIG